MPEISPDSRAIHPDLPLTAGACPKLARFSPSKTWVFWTLFIAITAAGAFLRFWRLDHQSYWIDEAYTINRIDGSFDRMLGMLSGQGFPPGWYCLLRWWTTLLEWWTGNGAWAFSPTATRSLTAIIGTLALPGMYFLARQFTDRKGSLLVMLLAAVNPFLIYYSRDIKMYGVMWCFLIWNCAFFFQWQTTRRHLIWFPLWVVTGFLMTSLHSMSWFLIGLQLVFLLTRPRVKWLDGPLWLIGAALVSLLPTYWFLHRSYWVEKIVDQGNAMGLDWNVTYTDMSWRTIASLPTAHLLGYLWPKYPPDALLTSWFELGGDFQDHLATRSWPWMVQWQCYVAAAFGLILLVGLVPWRGIRRSPERQASVTRGRWWWLALWIAVPMIALALTWIPQDSVWHHRIWGDMHPTKIWEPRYLGIIVPAWLLWLGASLRRLPTWPVRTVAIVFVVAACLVSSLSNHLLYRQAPWGPTVAAAMKYNDPAVRRGMMLGTPATKHPGESDVFAIQIARGVRPGVDDPFLPGSLWRRRVEENQYAGFLEEASKRRTLQTIVLTDRFGDEVPAADGKTQHGISDAEAATILGPEWKLVREEKYEWHFEWRFYIFNVWRTRVWVKEP